MYPTVPKRERVLLVWMCLSQFCLMDQLAPSGMVCMLAKSEQCGPISTENGLLRVVIMFVFRIPAGMRNPRAYRQGMQETFYNGDGKGKGFGRFDPGGL